MKPVALLLAILAALPVVTASLSEDLLVPPQEAVSDMAGTPVECVQNDGSDADGMECDAADTCEGAYHVITTAAGESNKGQLAPIDDESDYFIGDVAAYQGSRVRFSVAGFRMDYTVALLDNACNVLSEGTGQAPTAGTAADLRSLFSGVQPFQPISVDQLVLDGASSGSTSVTGTYATVDFRVINQPKHLTFDGQVYTMAPGARARLCHFTGDIQAALGVGGGNVKFDGVGSAVLFATGLEAFAACPPPPEPDANPSCAAHWCDFTVNSVTSNVRFGVRYLGPGDPMEPIVIPVTCHDGCLNLPAVVPNSYVVGFTSLS